MNTNRLLYTLFIFSILFMSACSKDTDKENNDNSLLVGVWSEEYNNREYFEFVFYDDDTGEEICCWGNGEHRDAEDPFTYSFDKKNMKLTIIYDESTVIYDVKMSGDRLKLTDPTGQWDDWVLYKIGGSSNIGESNVGDDSLAGLWRDLDLIHTFSFSANKTGSALIVQGTDLQGRSFKYSYNKKEGKLNIIFNDNLSPKSITFNIRLSGAANTMMELTCTSGNFDDLILWGTGTEG